MAGRDVAAVPVPAGGAAFDTLAARARFALETSKKKKIDVEREADLPKGYMTRILAGERKNLGPEIVQRLASALGVSHEWLASGAGSAEVPFAIREPQAIAYARAVPNVEAALEAFVWPGELEPKSVARLVALVRDEAISLGACDLPRSYWQSRIAVHVRSLRETRERVASPKTKRSRRPRAAR